MSVSASGMGYARHGQPVHLIANVITLKGGQSLWNGVPADEQTFTNYVQKTAAMDSLPFLIFDPDGANCQDATRLRDLIDQNYPCRDGLVAKGRGQILRMLHSRRLGDHLPNVRNERKADTENP